MLIQPYSSVWSLHFAKFQDILHERLEDLIIGIEHIGSTSVLGLAAKPIIDIDVVYPVNGNFKLIRDRLTVLGYYHNGDQGIPGREAFKRGDSGSYPEFLDQVDHHLYVCNADSKELQRHLLFRDFLQLNKWARQDYQSLKKEIALAAHQDRKVYAELKEIKAKPFIERLIMLAKTDLRGGIPKSSLIHKLS